MSAIVYSDAFPAFLQVLQTTFVGFQPDDGDASHVELVDQSAGNEVIGHLRLTIAGGNITGMEFRDEADTSPVITLTDISVDAVQFAAALAGATSDLQLYELMIGLIGDATTVTGSGGSDLIETGAGNDAANGGNGDDTAYKWKPGDFNFNGGAGIDTVEFRSQMGGVTVPSATATLVANLDGTPGTTHYGGILTLTNVENIVGTPLADTITGNDKKNLIGDGLLDQGADIIDARGGNDVVHLSDASQGAEVDGGDGTDELRFSLTGPVGLKPGKVVLDLLNPGDNAGTFEDVTVSGFEKFTVLNAIPTGSVFTFRGDNGANVVSGATGDPDTVLESGVDRLSGRGGDDRLSGLGGRDLLDGGTGDDTLKGGDGDDDIVGGRGRDTMGGGSGKDDFIFEALADLGNSASTRDLIEDFIHGVDDIDLSAIDANGSAAGDAGFRFLKKEGGGFTETRGELRWVQIDRPGKANDVTMVEGDINGDGKPDFQVQLAGLVDLTKGDFAL